MPKEHQVDISMEEQIKVSVEGTTRILDCLERNQVKATFFCTANFALHAPDIIKRIQEDAYKCRNADHRQRARALRGGRRGVRSARLRADDPHRLPLLRGARGGEHACFHCAHACA